MDNKNIIFWNVDTQRDFIEPDGKLYVPGAEKIRDVLKKITLLANQKKIRVVNTADFHYPDSPELDSNPDYIHTFPEHCMAESKGAEYIEETNPTDPVIFDWDKEYTITRQLLSAKKNQNIVIRKNTFDAFNENTHTSKILEILQPETVIVYGVTTNICVNFAVLGLIKSVKNVYVISDAIKELPGIELPFPTWLEAGVKMIHFQQLEEMLSV